MTESRVLSPAPPDNFTPASPSNAEHNLPNLSSPAYLAQQISEALQRSSDNTTATTSTSEISPALIQPPCSSVSSSNLPYTASQLAPPPFAWPVPNPVPTPEASEHVAQDTATVAASCP